MRRKALFWGLLVWVFGMSFPGCTPPPSPQAQRFREAVVAQVQALIPAVSALLPGARKDAMTKVLASFFQDHPERKALFTGLAVFDAQGRVISAYSPHRETASQMAGLDFSHYDAIHHTLRKKTVTTMVMYYLSGGRERMLAAVNFPLLRSGRLLGILTTCFWKSHLEQDERVPLEEFLRLDFHVP